MPAILLPTSLELLGRAANATNDLQPVVCSWPVSGQYGVGSRILYYVLVAACVLARKTEWLRNACLAAALILPAIAAIHAIVLAALHVDNAIDMDVYGALQICCIGILTAPACVRLSNTYFKAPGRNVLFAWTVLVIAGLLALAVEFFRAQSSPCLDDGQGYPLLNKMPFPYGETTCGLVCESGVKGSPASPMRTGSADNIYVVPTPSILTFGAATLVAAASCVPGVLSMVSIRHKITKEEWTKKFGGVDADEPIEGTNGATRRGMKDVNDVIRGLLSVVEIPVFGGAVIALIIVGELNFFNYPVGYQTEPAANIGQWSNITASVFAAGGSLYMLSSKWLSKWLRNVEKEEDKEEDKEESPCHCACHVHLHPDSMSDNSDAPEMVRAPSVTLTDPDVQIHRQDTAATNPLSPIRTETFPDNESAISGLGIHTMDSNASGRSQKRGGAREKLLKITASFGTPSRDRYNDSEFRSGKASGFPQIPGERIRNPGLREIEEIWGESPAELEDDHSPINGRRSRANSFNSISRASSIGPRAPSPAPPQRASTLGPVPCSVLGLPTTHSPESTNEPVFPTRPSDELEKARSHGTVVTLHEGPNSPAIILSSEDDPEESPTPWTGVAPLAELTSTGPSRNGGLDVPVTTTTDSLKAAVPQRSPLQHTPIQAQTPTGQQTQTQQHPTVQQRPSIHPQQPPQSEAQHQHPQTMTPQQPQPTAPNAPISAGAAPPQQETRQPEAEPVPSQSAKGSSDKQPPPDNASIKP
ncbi:uncharacterized protein C8A04DRAFT_34090 [Dichotomopilus funicola]|uniref:Uncharacterized protein n=1 Tax=Dichotomopilus funicola TaxID=1934379 RepID=A0AAN6ZQQ5_9PEZI|nr:hypothetical protein C8A04DRAFT_34090 [Dichotomopilus funicola]